MKSIERGKKSCGCAAHITTTRHGLRNTPLYDIWAAMKQRCLNPNSRNYRHYGGRGINICQEWIDDYLNFHKWANESGYKKGLTIDRENNDGNYEPGNCRWASTYINAENTRLLRSNNTSGYRGVFLIKDTGKWLAMIKSYGITYRLGNYHTPQEAARVYNDFIIRHKTNHPLNKVV